MTAAFAIASMTAVSAAAYGGPVGAGILLGLMTLTLPWGET